MFTTIVPEGDRLSGYLLAIEGAQFLVGRIRGKSVDRDVINRGPEAIVNLEGAPPFWQVRRQVQLIALQAPSSRNVLRRLMTSSGLNMLRFFSFRLFWRWISLLFGFPQAKLVANLFPARVPLLAS